jgi:hypothetical protein
MNKVMALKAKVRHFALKHKVPAQAVLQIFMLERLLDRIARSKYKDKFIKGRFHYEGTLGSVLQRTLLRRET